MDHASSPYNLLVKINRPDYLSAGRKFGLIRFAMLVPVGKWKRHFVGVIG